MTKVRIILKKQKHANRNI